MGRMKRPVLVLVIPILLCSISRAQEVNYGLSVGIGRASGIYDEDRYNSSMHSEYAYSVAALVEFPSSSNVNLQSGLKCYKTGHNVDLHICTFVGPAPVNYSATLLYLAIPLTAKYNLPFMSSISCIGGVEGTYLLSGSSIIELADDSSIEENKIDQFHTVNLSLVIGIGIEWHLDRVTFLIEPKYCRGLIDVTEDAPLGLAFRTEEISLNVGLKL